MPVSFRRRIARALPLPVMQAWWWTKDRTIERLKMAALKRFVERRGFHLGITGTLLNSRRGPLVICSTELLERGATTGWGQAQWVVALQPYEQFDAYDFMPEDPYSEGYAYRVPASIPLCTDLTVALEQAIIAMDKLRKFQPPREQGAETSAGATN